MPVIHVLNLRMLCGIFFLPLFNLNRALVREAGTTTWMKVCHLSARLLILRVYVRVDEASLTSARSRLRRQLAVTIAWPGPVTSWSLNSLPGNWS